MSIPKALTEAEAAVKVSTIGGKAPLRYTFKVMNGETVVRETEQEESEFVFVPMTAGTYTVQVTVTDGYGNTAAQTSEPLEIALRELAITSVAAASRSSGRRRSRAAKAR